MMIDKIRGIDLVQNLQNTQRTHKNESVKAADSVTLSAQAQQLSEIHLAMETAKNAQDVRADKVAEVSQKLKDPSYINDALLNSLADKILDAFGV